MQLLKIFLKNSAFRQKCAILLVVILDPLILGYFVRLAALSNPSETCVFCVYLFFSEGWAASRIPSEKSKLIFGILEKLSWLLKTPRFTGKQTRPVCEFDSGSVFVLRPVHWRASSAPRLANV